MAYRSDTPAVDHVNCMWSAYFLRKYCQKRKNIGFNTKPRQTVKKSVGIRFTHLERFENTPPYAERLCCPV